MSMHFTNVVKAQITQGLVKILLERAGYRVIRLGVEELFTEVIYPDQEKYLALDLPEPLRSLPDLLIADIDTNKTFLLGVCPNFEAKFHKSLLSKHLRFLSLSRVVPFTTRTYVD